MAIIKKHLTALSKHLIEHMTDKLNLCESIKYLIENSIKFKKPVESFKLKLAESHDSLSFTGRRSATL